MSAPTTTHRHLQEVVLRWMLAQDWCQAGAVEVSDLDVLGVTFPSDLRPSRRRKHPKPRITIAEVKRTRSDLLADLRAAKMQGYAAYGSHMYLAVTDEAMRWDGYAGEQRVLDDLTERGVPETWGILRLWWAAGHSWGRRPVPGRWCVTSVRRCRGGGLLAPTEAEVIQTIARLAQSLSHRQARASVEP